MNAGLSVVTVTVVLCAGVVVFSTGGKETARVRQYRTVYYTTLARSAVRVRVRVRVCVCVCVCGVWCVVCGVLCGVCCVVCHVSCQSLNTII